MPDFEAGDIVRTPFPYTDRNTRQRRPALVVSNGRIGPDGRLLWVAMITSVDNRPWPDDVDIGEDYALAGLPAPSVVRPTKIATVDAGRVDPIGKLPVGLMRAVDSALQQMLRR